VEKDLNTAASGSDAQNVTVSDGWRRGTLNPSREQEEVVNCTASTHAYKKTGGSAKPTGKEGGSKVTVVEG